MYADRVCDGIGIMLAGSTIGGIDIENCCQHDAWTKHTVIEDWAFAFLIDDHAYTEVRVSGTGLRIIGRCEEGPKLNRTILGGRVTLYRNCARYVTISGIKLKGEKRLTAIDELMDVILVRYDRQRFASRLGVK